MKKIKSIKQLRTEKKRLRKRKSDLEEKIKNNWEGLKRDFASGKQQKNDSGSAYNEKEANGNRQESFFEDILAFAAEKFARKMAGRAEEKFGEWFKK